VNKLLWRRSRSGRFRYTRPQKSIIITMYLFPALRIPASINYRHPGSILFVQWSTRFQYFFLHHPCMHAYMYYHADNNIRQIFLILQQN